MTTILAVLVALAVGFGGGYVVSGDKAATDTHDTHESSSMSHAMEDMTAELEGKKGDDFDKAFIDEMIVHHEGAVQMAKQALDKAKHAEIKQLANEIISAQTREISTMRGWLNSWYGTTQ